MHSDDKPLATKRVADDLAKYREALSLIEQMAPMADKLDRWGIDANGRLAETLSVLHETCQHIIEKLGEDEDEESARRLAQGWRDWAASGGGLNSDRRPLATKSRGAHSVYR
jgi:hypothetical protein